MISIALSPVQNLLNRWRDCARRCFRVSAPLIFALSLWWSAGKLIWKAGKLVWCASCPCGGSPAPCSCAWPTGLSATYTVSGWGALSACPTCDADATDPAWTGTLSHIGSGCTWWAADTMFNPLSINGVLLDITYTAIVLNTTACRWELYIACASLTNPTKKMWYGYKTTGSTPAGTYNFAGSDCGNTTPTMTVA